MCPDLGVETGHSDEIFFPEIFFCFHVKAHHESGFSILRSFQVLLGKLALTRKEWHENACVAAASMASSSYQQTKYIKVSI